MNFNTSPPTTVTGGSLNTIEGVASISDASGNLLFYTDGITAYDATNAVMNNGTGLLGDQSSTESAIIVKKPGSSTLYYLFTVSLPGNAGGVSYSIVDMSLNGGLGAITAAKNVLVYTPSTERICAVKHCNNKDIWIVSHYDGTNEFYAHLLTSAGLSAGPVISASGSVSAGSSGNGIGYLKVSPNGTKLAMVMRYTVSGSNQSIVEMDDFNNSTGVVSNALSMGGAYTYGYGVEFSPDGTRLYVNSSGGSFINQYNLCAGTPAQVAASATQIGTSTSSWMGAMQIGPDGKIYVARYSTGYLGVINSPNTLGLGCNYVDNGLALAGGQSQFGLPNFVANYFYNDTPVIASVVSVSNCLHADFSYTIPAQVLCSGIGTNPLLSLLWNFNDPTSGNADTSSQSSASHTFTASGTYSVKLILNYACYSDTTIYPITLVSCGMHVTVTGDTICGATCGNVSATASGSPPYTYVWTPNIGNGPGPYSVCPAATANYKVVVTDNNGSSDSAVATVMVTIAPTVTAAANNVSCNGQNNGLAIVHATGNTPFAYNWNTSPAQMTDTAQALSAGSYTVTVSDVNGCTASATATVSQPPLLIADISNVVNGGCSGSNNSSATVAATGGTGVYTYSWNTTPVQSTATATNLPAGSYIATVTDANGCSDTAGVTISAAALLTATTSVTSASCGNNNGTATVTAGGGSGTYSYSWNTTPVQTTNVAVNLGAGNYLVTVTDGNSCTISAAATVTGLGGLSAVISAVTNVSCHGGNDGSATVTASGGGGPYTYSWSTSPVQTAATAINLAAATYTVLVTDNNNCTVSDMATVIQPTAISLGFTTVNSSCGQNNGSITVNATGGTPSYSYAWGTNPVQTGVAATGLAPGAYSVVVTDSSGCMQSGSGNIQSTSVVVLNVVSFANASCFGAGDGQVVLGASGGVSPYQYSADNLNFNPATAFNNLAAGSYIFYVKDAGGCEDSAGVLINSPAQLAATAIAQPPLCYGEATGTAAVSVSSGTSPYRYSWNTVPVLHDSVITSLPAGAYSVTVTDNNNCTTTQSVILNDPQQLSINLNPYPETTIAFGDSILLTANASGSGAMHYAWQPAYGLSCSTCSPIMVSPGATTIYTVIATDTNNCLIQASIKVNVNIPTQTFIPNAFSPNGDGHNDVFMVYAEGVYRINLKVFDRWGEVVFESEDQNQGWDGRYRGKPENSGVFVYEVQITYLTGSTQNFSGSVTLLR